MLLYAVLHTVVVGSFLCRLAVTFTRILSVPFANVVVIPLRRSVKPLRAVWAKHVESFTSAAQSVKAQAWFFLDTVADHLVDLRKVSGSVVPQEQWIHTGRQVHLELVFRFIVQQDSTIEQGTLRRRRNFQPEHAVFQCL
jgi:hypothetical protein